jgi:CheY-like chemotaxis protein
MPRILVADDNPLSLRYFVAALARPGIECSEAADGEAAIQLASAIRHDLLLLDVRMPGCGGAEALARIRSCDGPSRSAPAIATTADDEVATREGLLARGFCNVLVKPIGAEALSDIVLRALPPVVAEPPPAWVDDAQALRAAGGDAAIVAALRGLLAQELAALPEELRRCTDDADAAALDERLHRLDASAGICGVPLLREASARVRAALASGWPSAEIDALLATAQRLRHTLAP